MCRLPQNIIMGHFQGNTHIIWLGTGFFCAEVVVYFKIMQTRIDRIKI